jgi:putative chitinase
MPKVITASLLRKMWPNCSADMLTAVVKAAPSVFDGCLINSPLRIAHFMAQISHESDGGRITAENLNYTHAEAIVGAWPRRFTLASAVPYLRNPRKLASEVYNGRMGNRPGTDDGFTYRGRGLLQITGRQSYEEMGEHTGLDLVNNPDLAFAPANALLIAATEFKNLGCLPYCDRDDVLGVTKHVNGGTNGLSSRRAWLAKWKTALAAVPDTPVASRVAMGSDLPRGADNAAPGFNDVLGTTEGKVGIGSGLGSAGLGFLSTMSDASDKVTDAGDKVSNISHAAQSLGILDKLDRLATSPAIWLAIALVAVGVYIWTRGHYRLKIEAA